MKFTADFDSVDSAELAATAIKNNISSFSNIKINENVSRYKKDIYSGPIIFNSFNVSVSSQLYASPIIVADYDSDKKIDDVEQRSTSSLEIVCSQEDEKTVSRLLISYGGRNIYKKQ